MTNAKKPGRPGAVRKSGKGPRVGSGGQGRQALEGKGPTPKAEDRPYHPAGKAKARAARDRRPDSGSSSRGGRSRRDDSEFVSGRNSVVEALRSGIPATALYVAARIEYDERVKEAVGLATERKIPLLEVMRPELDRLAGFDGVHQGLVLKVPPYQYSHVDDLVFSARNKGRPPLIVALDGVTDPRNLGAIIRSAAAFGADGVLIPQRRAAGVTASAWKTSAGAAARLPVAVAANLTQTLKSLKERGLFVVGLDGGGDTDLPGLELAARPLVVVVGSEGNGLSRLVTSTCDAIVSIPIDTGTESLNASVAASVALYEIAVARGQHTR